jgi:Ca2+-binding RTX toxin-like protein
MGGTRLTWDDILDGFDSRAWVPSGRAREAARVAALVQDDDDGRLAAVAAADAPRARPAIVRSGGPDVDELRGTEDDDTLRGLGGDDRLFGEGGEDDLFGGADNDLLIGGGEADRLFGEEGRDQLAGEDGIDRLVGGGDGDFYFVDDTDEVVDEDPGGGLDQVRSTVTFTLPDNVEILTLLGAAAIDGTGNELTNWTSPLGVEGWDQNVMRLRAW